MKTGETRGGGLALALPGEGAAGAFVLGRRG
jgi:hypothetical protein